MLPMIAALTLMFATSSSAVSVQKLSEEYLHQLFLTSPMVASQAGFHKEGVDRRLDDVSVEAHFRRIRFLADYQKRLGALDQSKLSPEELADVALLNDAVSLETQDLLRLRPFARRCDQPLDTLGSTFFFMAVRPYAPLERRLSDVVARLKELPRYLKQVEAGLDEYVEEFRLAAKDDGQGLLDYLEHQLPSIFIEARNQAALKPAIEEAAKAVREYLAFVDHTLINRPRTTFRVGASNYTSRFRPYLQTNLSPVEVLLKAERAIRAIRNEMATVAKEIVPGGDVRQALAKVAEDHPAPDQLVTTVRKDLEDARAFVVQKGLLTVPHHQNLEVLETPPFMRSQLGVAAFDGAPPLEPELGAFFYVTPFPGDWPKEKIESKLREYNRRMLDLLTIHEAMPGHYLQFEQANHVKPEWRRTLRWLLGAGSYVEGWAVYAQDMMVHAGYRNGDPKLRLQALKLRLRAAANAALDIRLHTQNLSDQDAMKLLVDEAYQEKTEAELKLRRAKLSVTQLCSYFVGGEAGSELRRDAEKSAGAAFNLRVFHDRALAEGAVTLPTLRRLLSVQ
jgi:uncharacterized protein (DUF885 family)